MSAPASRPNAIRTHTYAPPSSGIAAPSSALASADGMKKVTNSTASQVNACSPPIAIAPMVSTTTIADIRKQHRVEPAQLAAQPRLLLHGGCGHDRSIARTAFRSLSSRDILAG